MASVFYTAQKTIKNYASGGNVLIFATALALLVVNLPFTREIYESIWLNEVELRVGDFNLFSHHGAPMSIMAFINDALMALFFFSVGLEIKREVLVGELSSFRNALLPIIAAIGGMGVPVIIYWFMSKGTAYAGGAAIPMATDIAFSLGVLAMLGNRVPIGLKVFLTTLAVVDDIGGIIVIAAFYSTHIDYMLLLYAAACMLVLFVGGKLGIQSKMFYVFLGAVVWFCFLNAGIHPTIAGVLVAFTVPAQPQYDPRKYIKKIKKAMSHFQNESDETGMNKRTILSNDQMNWLKQVESASDKVISPLQELEDTLHPFVNYFIIPLFAFANAGIFLLDTNPMSAFEGISLAIMCGLIIGKFVGIFTFSWITVKLKLAPMPAHSNWHMMASVAMLGGIGFTVSLFIATLSFGGAGEHLRDLLDHAKLGIVLGSLISGIIGFVWLHFTLPKTAAPDVEEN